MSKPRACKDPYFWNATTIQKLLDVQEYIGDTVNFKTYSNSYKDSKFLYPPCAKWPGKVKELISETIKERKELIAGGTQKFSEKYIKTFNTKPKKRNVPMEPHSKIVKTISNGLKISAFQQQTT